MPVTPEIGANGAFCKAGAQTCTAPEYAIVNYINREVNSKTMIGFRSDLLNDKKGQRTGIATKYTENTLYATRCVDPNHRDPQANQYNLTIERQLDRNDSLRVSFVGQHT